MDRGAWQIQSIGSQRVGQDLSDLVRTQFNGNQKLMSIRITWGELVKPLNCQDLPPQFQDWGSGVSLCNMHAHSPFQVTVM